MSDLDEFIREFLNESSEGLDQIDNDLVALEDSPDDVARMDSVFRTLHTIKGNSGFFEFATLGSIAHAGETLLDRLRKRELTFNSELANGLLKLVDAVREILKVVKKTGKEPASDQSSLLEMLARLASDDTSDSGSEDAKKPATAEDTVDFDRTFLGDLPTDDADATFISDPSALETETESAGDEPGEADTDAARFEPGESFPDPAADQQTMPVTESSADDTKSAGTEPSAEVVESTASDATVSGTDEAELKDVFSRGSGSSLFAAKLSGGTIRVDVDLLDQLLNNVGELVLARNQVLEFTSGERDSPLLGASQRLNRITSELQEGFMKTRMQHIGSMWQKYPRVVRDFARQCGKKVVLQTEGTQTELDRSLIEAIADPLTHLLRNAIDHGIETPHERRLTDKPETGTLRLRAYQEGGSVTIELSDDGRGIDPKRIRQRLVERGLVTTEQCERTTDREIVNAIFLPGFSTAESVSNVSGRGVGMDVVNTRIEQVGGAVDLQSEPGKGTTVRLRVPLTLAIIPALIVSSESDRYAIPQLNLVELITVPSGKDDPGIERYHDCYVYRLRDALLPVVCLNEMLGLIENWKPTSTEPVPIVVLTADDRQFGLVVDGIRNTEEIVVKPIDIALRKLATYAGATLMSDGRVSLILDVPGLARRAGLFNEERLETSLRSDDADDVTELQQRVLVCLLGDRGRIAIPADGIESIEKIETGRLERSSHRHVVQHRGDILPLISLHRHFFGESERTTDETSLTVVVYQLTAGSVGLIVDRVLDIAETPERNIRKTTGTAGVDSNTTIDGHVVDVVNVADVIAAVDPDLFESTQTVIS